tara:strand:- start:4583 stop:5077 length:495 start_codon:yes stop_codon:yes gene_type:complete
MSWDLAVLAASAASAASQYSATKRQARAGAQASRIQAETAQTNKSMVELQALNQESDRQLELRKILATNINAVDYDPYSSASFLTIEDTSKKTAQTDIDRIRLLGKTKAGNYEQAVRMANIEGSAFRGMGRTAWLQPAGTLLQGAYKAHQIKVPSKVSSKKVIV